MYFARCFVEYLDDLKQQNFINWCNRKASRLRKKNHRRNIRRSHGRNPSKNFRRNPKMNPGRNPGTNSRTSGRFPEVIIRRPHGKFRNNLRRLPWKYLERDSTKILAKIPKWNSGRNNWGIVWEVAEEVSERIKKIHVRFTDWIFEGKPERYLEESLKIIPGTINEGNSGETPEGIWGRIVERMVERILKLII